MSDVNKAIAALSAKKKKILKDLEEMAGAYGKLEADMRRRYKDEISYNKGSTEGLEDFYMLNALIRRNGMAVKNAAGLIGKMKDMSGYEISEEEILDRIFDKKRTRKRK